MMEQSSSPQAHSTGKRRGTDGVGDERGVPLPSVGPAASADARSLMVCGRCGKMMGWVVGQPLITDGICEECVGIEPSQRRRWLVRVKGLLVVEAENRDEALRKAREWARRQPLLGG